MMEPAPLAVIRVVGVGGGGVNAVNRMIESNLRGVEFIAINTDAQALLMSDADVKLEIGRESTHGLGAGADPEVGKAAATAHEDDIREVLRDSNMVFVTAGEGGGTGTGGAPIVAGIARELGALTIGVVTRPFQFEGRRREQQADRGIEALREQVDALIVIPNQRLLESTDANLSVLEAFRAADQVLQSSVQGITEIITIPGTINVDFADVTTTLKDAKTALMGIGTATGPDRALTAVEMAISSPLLESSMDGADRVLIFFQGGTDLGMQEMNDAAQMVRELADPEANVIIGYAPNEEFADEIKVTVIAAGFEREDGNASSARVVQTSSATRTAARPAATTPSAKPAAASAKPTATTRVSEPSEPRTVPQPSAEAPATAKPAPAPAETVSEKEEILDGIEARLAQHRHEPAAKVPELKAPKFPAGTEAMGTLKPKPEPHQPEIKLSGLSGIPDAKREPLAVTSGIRPVSPDAASVPNYVDSSREQHAPALRLEQVFDDIARDDELDIPDFLK